MPNLTVDPTSIFAAIDCGQDTTIEVTIDNAGGLGDGIFDILFTPDDIMQTSEIFYDFTNITTHTFLDISPNAEELAFEVVINGDFDDFTEEASVFIENTFIEVIDGNVTNGTCLLYTSPSPRDATLSRMPSSA